MSKLKLEIERNNAQLDEKDKKKAERKVLVGEVLNMISGGRFHGGGFINFSKIF